MMRSTARVTTLLSLTLCAAVALPAQVGTTPERSPFRDTEIRQHLVVFVGQSTGGRDIAGAAPRGGDVLGVRYDLPLGQSPMLFTSSLMRQGARRDILQPGLPIANRVGATVDQPLYFLDLGLTLLLTGNKSWRSLVPSVTGTVGFATDNKGVVDSSNFSFGNRFSVGVNLGLKYAPLRSRWAVRGDVMNRFYSVRFPASFRTAPTGVETIVPLNSNSDWTRNTIFSLGLVRELGRR
jgi:hypothetical protein